MLSVRSFLCCIALIVFNHLYEIDYVLNVNKKRQPHACGERNDNAVMHAPSFSTKSSQFCARIILFTLQDSSNSHCLLTYGFTNASRSQSIRTRRLGYCKKVGNWFTAKY